MIFGTVEVLLENIMVLVDPSSKVVFLCAIGFSCRPSSFVCQVGL